MYRLVEENRNIERRLDHPCSPSLPPKRKTNPLATNKSPPRLPYDELQMDQKQRLRLQQYKQQQQQQEDKLSLRSRLIEGDNISTVTRPPQPHLDCIDNNNSMDNSSNHSSGSGSAHSSQSRRMDRSMSDSSIQSGDPPQVDRRRGRKSHPWETDVKINRFTSAPAAGGGRPPLVTTGTSVSRTQQSTLGWKQRMQERRAVFGNVAVPEQSFDEDDGIMSDDDDDDSSGEEQIREEAVELLKSKGFHNFQGILDHQYDDDLESVGGSVITPNHRAAAVSPFVSPPPGTAGNKRHTIKLGEIQTLRQKILLQQQEKNDGSGTLLEDDDEEEDQPFDQQQLQQAQGLLNSGATRSAKTVAPVSTTAVTAPEDNEDAVRAWRVMKQLRVRLQDVVTEDYFILEAMGRKGVGTPSQPKVVIDENAFQRHKLRDAVERRVSQVFTGDHQIVINGEIQVQDDDSVMISESLSGDTGNNFASPKSRESELDYDDAEEDNEDEEKKTESIKSPQLRERLSDSFMAFEAMLRARQQESVEGDDWTVCSASVAEPTIRNQKDMLPSLPSATHAAGDDDDDNQSCYSEYTVDTTSYQTGNRVSIVSTATAVNGIAFDNLAGMDDSRKTIKVNNSQATDLASKLQGITINHADDDDDNSYAEYTVLEECTLQEAPKPVLADPFRQPGQAPFPVQSSGKDSDDQSYMELTVADSESQSIKRTASADQSYMEVTVVGRAADYSPTRHPPQKQDRSDDESYMEFTVAEQPANPGVLMSPPDLTSPHMTSMLSSRMFADMQLPTELQQQQPPQRGLEDEHANYPTITIDQDDDDMTQITFDHTMMDDTGSFTPDHRHAIQYFDDSNKNKEKAVRSFSNGDITSVVGSLHTEQTRDTTVSDDASSHQDGASFKSCVSSESNQMVAELLRRDIWSPDAGVVQASLEKLGGEALKGYHERSNIVRYGGLLAMLRAMEMKPDEAQIQIAAYAALEKMSLDASTQLAIGEVGGIPAIANSMKGHADSIEVQQAACKALSNLTRHREGGTVPTEGVVEAVSKAMTQHPEDAEIQAHAFATLANLCLDNQARLRELKKSSGLAAMTMALQVTWANQTDQHEAISTLSILLRSMTALDKN